MLALMKLKKGKGFVELREVEEPKIKDDEVLIQVMAAGICGTDIHIYHDEHPYWPPLILGHEFSGKITQVGEAVEGWKKGDRVVAEPHTQTCGVCQYCRSGRLQFCPQKRGVGWGQDGAFASFVKIPGRLLHRIPDNVSFEEAALAEPMAIAVTGVLERTRVEPEDLVVVLGPGPVGLLSAVIAKAEGAAKVIVSGTAMDVPLRLKAARKLGIDYIVNVDEEDLSEKVRSLTGGWGADLVVEASGSEKAINQALEIVKRDGRVSVIGIVGRKNINMEWDRAVFKAIRIIFSFSSSPTSWERGLSLMATGKVKISPLISHKFPLADWEKAFGLCEEKKTIKALLIPS